jgi:hypothetical protein
MTQADPVVPPAGFEDLTVRGVMAQERDLGHHNREHSGVSELPPAVADPDETHDPGIRISTAPISLAQ